MRPCDCDNVTKSTFVHDGTEEQCFACWAWYFSEKHRERWGGPAEAPLPPAGTALLPEQVTKKTVAKIVKRPCNCGKFKREV